MGQVLLLQKYQKISGLAAGTTRSLGALIFSGIPIAVEALGWKPPNQDARTAMWAIGACNCAGGILWLVTLGWRSERFFGVHKLDPGKDPELEEDEQNP